MITNEYSTSRFQCLEPSPQWPTEGELGGVNIIIHYKTLDSPIPWTDLEQTLGTNIAKMSNGGFGPVTAPVDQPVNLETGQAVVHFQPYPCKGKVNPKPDPWSPGGIPDDILQPTWAQLAQGLEGVQDILAVQVGKGGVVKRAWGTVYLVQSVLNRGEERFQMGNWIQLGMFEAIEKKAFDPKRDLFKVYQKQINCETTLRSYK